MNGSSPSVATPATPRHLKRLSLAITPGQASSYSSPIRLTPVSGGRRQLSLGLDTASSPTGSPSTAALDAEALPVASTSLSTSSPVSQPQVGEGAWTTLPGTPSSPFSPGGAPRSGGGRSGGRASHSRGASSISYSNASRGNDLVRSPAGLGQVSAGGSPVTSPSPTSFSRLRGDGDSLSPYQRQRERSNEGLGGGRSGENLQLDGLSEESEAEALKGGLEGSGAGTGASSTFTELGGDLLSFIAKKERKCLDLREELKRHEDQLAELKKKWSTIVAKSLAPPTQAAQSRATTTENSKRIFSSRTTSLSLSASPSALPRPLARDPSSTGSEPTFATFDVDPNLAFTNAEVAESVQAAKAWVGGVFGKVLEAVGGGEAASEPDVAGPNGRQLVALTEEEEPEEEAAGSVRGMEDVSSPKSSAKALRSGSVSSGDEWRSSRRTMSSVTSSSSFNSLSSGGSSMGFSTKVPSESGASESTLRPDGISAPPSPLVDGPASPPSPALQKSLPPRPRPQEGGHNRRRSTFDMLGSAAGGTLAGLGKRWAIVSQSETFKSGRAAVESTLDTFEKKLAETLGPLEEDVVPSSSVSLNAERGAPVDHMESSTEEQAEMASWASTAPASAAAARSQSQSSSSSSSRPPPKVETELDWSAFLDSPDSTISPSSALSPPMSKSLSGGYRSHPLTPTRASDIFDGSPSPLPSPSLRRLSTASPTIQHSSRTRTTPPVTSSSSSSSSPRRTPTAVVKEKAEEEWGW